MIVAYHCIFGFYGFWLPNDPRGVGSTYIGRWELLRYGTPTRTRVRHTEAGRMHDHEWQERARLALSFPPAEITGEQAVALAAGFAKGIAQGGYRVHACTILPDHVHLVVVRHQRRIRQVVGHLKAAATRSLKERKLWLRDECPVWAEHGWNVWLSDQQAVSSAISYVEENPVKEGKRRQTWRFVVPYDPTAILERPQDVKERSIGGAALASRRHKQRRNRQAADPRP